MSVVNQLYIKEDKVFTLKNEDEIQIYYVEPNPNFVQKLAKDWILIPQRFGTYLDIQRTLITNLLKAGRQISHEKLDDWFLEAHDIWLQGRELPEIARELFPEFIVDSPQSESMYILKYIDYDLELKYCDGIIYKLVFGGGN
jgi:hypothetical protein